jgi:dynein heavy chain
MSSSGLNWKPVVSAWLKSRSSREKEVFQKLFNDSFGIMYSWSTQNLCLVMKVLQANITCQVFYNSFILFLRIWGYFVTLFLLHQFFIILS